MALTLRFLISSFSKILPWSYCHKEWDVICLEENIVLNDTVDNLNKMSPAELYFQ